MAEKKSHNIVDFSISGLTKGCLIVSDLIPPGEQIEPRDLWIY